MGYRPVLTSDLKEVAMTMIYHSIICTEFVCSRFLRQRGELAEGLDRDELDASSS